MSACPSQAKRGRPRPPRGPRSVRTPAHAYQLVMTASEKNPDKPACSLVHIECAQEGLIILFLLVLAFLKFLDGCLQFLDLGLLFVELVEIALVGGSGL